MDAVITVRAGTCLQQNICLDQGKVGNYIFCLMGKSASGKDTIYRKIREIINQPGSPDLKEVVPYTTRPIREGEENGKTYWFETDSEFEAAKAAGRIIEYRDYNTVYGVWHYYTKDDGQIDLSEYNYLLIGTLEAYRSLQNYYGAGHLVPLYIELEDGERLQRALNREREQEHPRYAEMCRRFLADEEDFSEEKIRQAGITVRYQNRDLESCVEQVWSTILNHID